MALRWLIGWPRHDVFLHPRQWRCYRYPLGLRIVIGGVFRPDGLVVLNNIRLGLRGRAHAGSR